MSYLRFIKVGSTDTGHRHPHSAGCRIAGVYLLEFAGDDDPFAAAEAATAATGVTRIAPGLATASAFDEGRVRGLAFTRWGSELLGRSEASLEAVAGLLESTRVDRSGSVAVRARDVRGTAGVDTQAVERALGRLLVDRGYEVDLDTPDHELRAVFADGMGALGWLVVEATRGFGDRMPTEKPFFQPGSMDPMVARAVANLGGAGPSATLLDPMCGTGGLLIEAGLVGTTVVGFDAQPKMVRGSRENLEHFLSDGFAVGLADAARLPVRSGAVHGVVVDVPYGRQSAVAAADLDELVRAVLAEARRVAGRAVVVADRPHTDEAEAAGWTVEAVFERRVHRSLTRHVHLLTAPVQ